MSHIRTNEREKASEYVKEKGSEVGHLTAHEGQEVLDHIQRAKHYFMEKAGVAMDMVTENAHTASDFVAEKAKVMEEEAVSITEKAKDFVVEKTGEAKDFIIEKAGEAKELATDMSKKRLYTLERKQPRQKKRYCLQILKNRLYLFRALTSKQIQGVDIQNILFIT